MTRGRLRPAAVLMALCAGASCGGKAGDRGSTAPGHPGPAASPAPVAHGSTGPVSSQADQLAAIEKAIGDRGVAVYDCRSRAAADDLRVDGEIDLELVLDGSGGVREVRLARDTVSDPVLSLCLKNAWAAYRFDARFADGDVVRLPPYRFESEGAQYTVRVEHVAPARGDQGKVSVRSVLTPANTGNPAAAMTLTRLRHGGASSVAVTAGERDILYVLRGPVSVQGQRQGKPLTVAEGGAVYTSSPLTVTDRSGDSLVLDLRVHDVDGRGRALIARGAGDAEALSIAGGKGTVHLYFDAGGVGDRGAYLGAFEAQPGTEVPEHVHESSSEYLLITAGEARMMVEGVAFPVAAGSAIQVPPGTRHSVVVLGTTPLRAIQFYTPSGPEQRFRRKPAG